MTDNVLLLFPVFFPLMAALISLVLSRNNMAQRWIAVIATFVAWVTSGMLLFQNWDAAQGDALQAASVQIYRLGNWMPPYGIVLVADMLSSLFGVMTTTVVLGSAIYTLTTREEAAKLPMFVPAFLIMTAGLNGTYYTGDMFTLFVFIELMVISAVILVTISDDENGLESAMKYLFINAMGTLFLLIGIAATYGSFGTLNMADMAATLQTGQRPLLAQAGAVMLVVVFLLKSGVFPFHFWQPDFHTVAPTAISAMLSSVVVKIGVYGILRIVTLLYRQEAPFIQDILIGLGLVGIFFGSLAAMRTQHPKRMLAYSTLGQIGFILVGIGWGSPIALVGAIVFAFNHALIKSALLMLSGVVISQTKYKVGNFVNLIGVGKIMPWTGVLYLVGAMALAGVPPLNGFIGKLALVQGGIDVESWVVLGLVVGGGLLTLIYMTQAYVLMFQRKPTEATAALKLPGKADPALAPAILTVASILLGLYATPLIEVAQVTVEQIADPMEYIEAVLSLRSGPTT